MSSIIGKKTRVYKKTDIASQSSTALSSVGKTTFLHKATGGESVINLQALNTPPEVSGFVNPTAQQISGYNLFTNKDNISLISSHAGALAPYVDYTVTTGSTIAFKIPLEPGEIIAGTIDLVPRANEVKSGYSIQVTGTLLANTTDFNVGTPFIYNKYPTKQVGDVLVFADGALMARCENNLITNDGNYIEVSTGNTQSSVIRFKTTSYDRNIVVVSNGYVVERNDSAIISSVESLSGRLDTVATTVAALAGVPASNFSAPSNVDLQAFGNRVLSLEQQLAAFLTRKRIVMEGLGTVQSVPNLAAVTLLPTIGTNTGDFTYSAGLFTANRSGEYLFQINQGLDLLNTPAANQFYALRLYHNNVVRSESFIYTATTAIVDLPGQIIKPLIITAGDVIKFEVVHATGATQQTFGAATQNLSNFSITRLDP